MNVTDILAKQDEIRDETARRFANDLDPTPEDTDPETETPSEEDETK